MEWVLGVVAADAVGLLCARADWHAVTVAAALGSMVCGAALPARAATALAALRALWLPYHGASPLSAVVRWAAAAALVGCVLLMPGGGGGPVAAGAVGAAAGAALVAWPLAVLGSRWHAHALADAGEGLLHALCGGALRCALARRPALAGGYACAALALAAALHGNAQRAAAARRAQPLRHAYSTRFHWSPRVSTANWAGAFAAAGLAAGAGPLALIESAPALPDVATAAALSAAALLLALDAPYYAAWQPRPLRRDPWPLAL